MRTWRNQDSHSVRVETQNGRYGHSEKQFGGSIKLNIHLPYEPTVPLLGIYLREMNMYVQTRTYT